MAPKSTNDNTQNKTSGKQSATKTHELEIIKLKTFMPRK